MNTTDPSLDADNGASPGLCFTIRKILRAANRAALGTILAGEERPYVSLVTTATDYDGSPLLLLSRLADHTRNLDADTHVSLLFDGTAGYANPQQGPRVTLMGRIEHCPAPRVRQRFLGRHPGAALYADFADFAFYRVQLERVHWVGGFARARWLDQGLACDWALSERFEAAAPALLQELNNGQTALLTTLANQVLKKRGKGWQAVAIDADGIDLKRENSILRLAFPQPLTSFDGLIPALSTLTTD
ncbi:pyridoxamine 5'-phosphate oxidase [mine drainage metagenome]|uniref:Pyridoxamine 5'-phosphate oxidase n=1 Tax=mine drainage metagenome TaxID=410659 RepID=A0A1J5SVF5_9ZZZZ